METESKRVYIKRVVSWTHPYIGNRHTMPYGKLEVSDGEISKIVSTKGDTLETYYRYECQYITFKRKAYRVVQYYEGHLHKMRLEPIED